MHPEIGFATASSDSPEFAGKLGRHTAVQSVSRDVQFQMDTDLRSQTFELSSALAAAESTDPTSAALYACQWHLPQIGVTDAWAKGHFGDPNVKVAVLDSGVDPFHVDLQGRVDIENSTSFLAPGTSPCGAEDENSFYDLFLHGTYVSSLITSNGVGIAAPAPHAQVVGVKVLNCAGIGQTSETLAGILYAANLPDVHVLNMSLGGFVFRNDPVERGAVAALNKAVAYAKSRGKIIFSAAGNQGIDLTHDVHGNVYAFPTEATVGIYATDNQDQLASYSNHGTAAVWFGAPGRRPPEHAARPARLLFPAAPVPGPHPRRLLQLRLRRRRRLPPRPRHQRRHAGGGRRRRPPRRQARRRPEPAGHPADLEGHRGRPRQKGRRQLLQPRPHQCRPGARPVGPLPAGSLRRPRLPHSLPKKVSKR